MERVDRARQIRTNDGVKDARVGQTNETMAESDKQSKSYRDNEDDSRTGAATDRKTGGCGLSGQNAQKWLKCGRTTDAETTGQTV